MTQHQTFSTGFGAYTYDGDSITATRDDFTYTATVHHDSYHGAPWDDCDGHGPVSDWTNRDKLPGELILTSHTRAGQRRYYDFAEACRIARRDGWGFLPHRLTIERDTPSKGDGRACGGWARADYFAAYDSQNFNRAIAAVYAQHKATYPSARAYAASAARHDFDVLRAWCNDEWTYCGIVLTVTDPNGAEIADESLWGIEMNYPGSDNAYLLDVANELAEQAHDSHVLPMLQASATVAALACVERG